MAIETKEEEMKELGKAETGRKVKHHVTAAVIEKWMSEMSILEGKLGDSKRREREEVDEAWAEYNKLWSPLSSSSPDIEGES